MKKLIVSSKSNPNSVAGAVVGILKDFEELEIEVIGAGALNQAVKAIVISRGYLAPVGVDLVCIPTFTTIKIDDEDMTGIKLVIKKN